VIAWAIVSSTRFLAYREDRRTVMVGTLNLVLLVAPYGLDLSLRYAALFIPLCGLLSFSSWAIIHNHIHVRTFRVSWLNAVGAMLIGLTVGHPPTGLVLTHNMNHHVHIGTGADWSRPANAGVGWGALRLLRYVVVTPLRMARGRTAAGAPQLPPALRRQRARERWLLYPLALAALVVRPTTLLCFTLPIWALGSVIFLGVNLLQHDACDPSSQTAHSRDFTGRFINFIFFHGGYHTVHHNRPGLHWSRLPEEHRRRLPGRAAARPDLETPSILAHLAREYLLPRGMWRAR
jgi:beta-carotene hydroxylase